jgi:hypothetical protein
MGQRRPLACKGLIDAPRGVHMRCVERVVVLIVVPEDGKIGSHWRNAASPFIANSFDFYCVTTIMCHLLEHERQVTAGLFLHSEQIKDSLLLAQALRMWASLASLAYDGYRPRWLREQITTLPPANKGESYARRSRRMS